MTESRHPPGCPCTRCTGFEAGPNELRASFEEGNEAALRSGVYSDRKLIPVAEEEYRDIRETIKPWEDVYEPIVRTLAEVRARVRLAVVYLDKVGLTADDGELRPLLRELPRWEREVVRVGRELALTVRSRAELRLTEATADMVSVASVRAVMAAHQAAINAVVPEHLWEAYVLEMDVRLEDLRLSELGPDVVEGEAREIEAGPSLGPLDEEEPFGEA